MSDKIDVLDKGYVRLVDHMGSDLSVVNAARASFSKESDVLKENDKKLIKFLGHNGHTSPFRHAFLQFEVYAPLMVARQWWKYVVGSDHTMDGWNESSRRYVTMEPEFYIPQAGDWRSTPEDKKQGSGDFVPSEEGKHYTADLIFHIEKGEELYQEAMDRGIAAEQARLFLNAYGMYVVWRWSTSLQSVCHFLNQRLADDAQHEITDFAGAVLELTQPHFPVTIDALVERE